MKTTYYQVDILVSTFMTEIMSHEFQLKCLFRYIIYFSQKVKIYFLLNKKNECKIAGKKRG